MIELQPYDEHNQRLEANVHPPDWTNPAPDGPYDLVVIGAGTAGLVTAAVAAGLGAKTALVERNLMGGDCLNVGCVPSKGLLSAARAAARVKNASEFGVHLDGGYRVDFAQVMERMRRLRADISPADSAKRFSEEKGVAVHLGDAEFTGGDTVRVGEQTLRFKKAVIATGARAAAPPIEGLGSIAYLTNESLFSLTELPGSLGVIGAGPIGAEMAQAFARFGSEVHLVNAGATALPREDPDAGRIVQAALERDGVRFHNDSQNLRLSSEGDRVRMQADTPEGPVDVVVEKLLVAVGRAPNVDGLGLEKIGVEYDLRKGVKVNDLFQTTNPKVYAAGDVCSPYKFTHAADFMARSVVANALFTPLGLGKRKASKLVIPWATYTSPEVAHVGLTENDAKDRNIPITTFRQDLEHVDRAILDGQTEGFVKIHVAEGSDKILGATIVAENAGDLIGSISVAMSNGVGLGGVASSIHPYPTQAEAIRKVGDLYSRTKLTPFAAKFLKWMLKLSV
ncbi:Mercuric reductase [Planctomycetes bacterium MalM25]|nr:Mercuric reductase [Planctomycetes bacterium MalM25]